MLGNTPDLKGIKTILDQLKIQNDVNVNVDNNVSSVTANLDLQTDKLTKLSERVLAIEEAINLIINS